MDSLPKQPSNKQSLGMRAAQAAAPTTQTFFERKFHGRSVVQSSGAGLLRRPSCWRYCVQFNIYVPYKSKSSTFPRESVFWDVDISDFTEFFKHPPQIVRRRSVGQVAHFQRHHAINSRRRPPVTHGCFLEIPNSQKIKHG